MFLGDSFWVDIKVGEFVDFFFGKIIRVGFVNVEFF